MRSATTRRNGRPPSRLPAHPLDQMITERGIYMSPLAIGDRLSRAWSRAKATGRLTHDLADELAIRVLSVHPCAVWGDDWWTPQDEQPIGLWPADLDFDLEAPVDYWPAS